MGMGKVYWDRHPLNKAAPDGHQNEAGEGELISLGTDEFSNPSGIIETEAGAFIAIRLAVLRRHQKKAGDAEEDRREHRQSDQRVEQSEIVQETEEQQAGEAYKQESTPTEKTPKPVPPE
jgi:hypothetical protein